MGHALAAHHAAAAFADQRRRRRRLAVARSRSLVEVQAQSVYHLTKSLESERGANNVSTSGPGVENTVIKKRTVAGRRIVLRGIVR